MRRRSKAYQHSQLAAATLLVAASLTQAQAPPEIRKSFAQWAKQSLHPVTAADLDAPTEDLAPIANMIGDARIVGVSEGQHGAAEPLIFRNRLFKHLVEHAGFTVIALESGIVEGRVLNDYVTEAKGELDPVLAQGLSNGFHTFQQNRDLIRWMREHNARVPRGAEKLQIFGLDVPGSPGNFDSARRPDTALRTALAYLGTVDAQAATQLHARVDTFLPVLADIDPYGGLKQPERDALTAAIADLIALLEREKHLYIGKSSKDAFEWALRTAIGARQTDTWFRTMPLEWKLERGLAWTREAMQVRDRTMADNLEWVRDRLRPGARMLVFAASGHLASTPVLMTAAPFGGMVPMGTYLEERHGRHFIGILNLVANGEIHYCSANPRRVLKLKPPPEAAIESLFASVDVPGYLLDLRQAPPAVSKWLRLQQEHWNGFIAAQFPTAAAFDLVYFVSPISPACEPQT